MRERSCLSWPSYNVRVLIRSVISLLLLVGPLVPEVRAQSGRHQAADSLKLEAGGELLARAGYEPSEFVVRVAADDPADEAESPWVARFPSPRPDDQTGEQVNTVVLEWFPAQPEDSTPQKSPAVLVLHTLDRRLFMSRGVARVLAREGIHAFVMHFPGYGLRQYDRYRALGDRFFDRSAQTIADARRARDAIAALPAVDPSRISIHGTSLGGFYATAAASIDDAFEHTFIFMAGADLYGVLTRGVREAAWVRESLERNGVTDDRLRKLCEPLDPARTANRLDPARTWLYSAQADQVVPADSARALAQAIGLDEEHHTWLSGDHYAALLHLPWIAERMAEVIGECHAPHATPAGKKP